MDILKIPFDEIWYHYLTAGWRVQTPAWFQIYNTIEQKVYKLMPSEPHCVECGTPMASFGGMVLRFNGSTPSSFSSIFYSGCERNARKKECGAEIKLSMNSADIPESTPLAESTLTADYKALGSAANMCTRLSSQTGAGETLVSEEAAEYAGIRVYG